MGKNKLEVDINRYILYTRPWGFSAGTDGKESVYGAGNLSSIPGLRGSPRRKERRMATHSSTLAWRIPQIEEPGGLQSMGSQRVS